MARIAGIDIPNDKRIVISLTYVFGIGNPLFIDEGEMIVVDTRTGEYSSKA